MPSLPSIQRNCPICDAAQHTPLGAYTVTEWPVVSCDCCDFVYLARGIDYSALKQDHAWEKSHKQESKRRRKHLLYRLDRGSAIMSTPPSSPRISLPFSTFSGRRTWNRIDVIYISLHV